MNKLVWASTACLILALVGCNNSFTGSKLDITAKNNALAEKIIQQGNSMIWLTDSGFQVSIAGENSTAQIHFEYQYDYNSITEGNKAIRIFLVNSGATQNAPAGVLKEKKVTSVSHTETTVILHFDATGDSGVGYAVYVDGTKVTFNDGLYYLNSNRNQKQGEEADSFFYSTVSGLKRTMHLNVEELNKFETSLFSGYSETNVKEPFVAGKSTSMIVGQGLIYEPVEGTLGNLTLKKFDYAASIWKTVEDVSYRVKAVDTPLDRTYSVIAEGFSPAAEKDVYLLYIAQPQNIRFKQYKAADGDTVAASGGEITLPWSVRGVINSVTMINNRDIHTKSDYATFSQVFFSDLNNALTIEFGHLSSQKKYLKITIKANSDANYNKIADAWTSLRAGIMATGAEQTVKFFSNKQMEQNIELTIDFKNLLTQITNAKRHEVYWYPVMDGVSSSSISEFGVPLMYVRNDFKIKKGFASDLFYNDLVHPFASPAYAIPPYAVMMPNWSRAL